VAGTVLNLRLLEHIRAGTRTGAGSGGVRQRGENVAAAAVHVPDPGGEVAER